MERKESVSEPVHSWNLGLDVKIWRQTTMIFTNSVIREMNESKLGSYLLKINSRHYSWTSSLLKPVSEMLPYSYQDPVKAVLWLT